MFSCPIYLFAALIACSTFTVSIPVPQSTDTNSSPLPQVGHSRAEMLAVQAHGSITHAILPRSDTTSPPDRTTSTQNNENGVIASVTDEEIATFAGSPFSGTAAPGFNDILQYGSIPGSQAKSAGGPTTASNATQVSRHRADNLHLLNGSTANPLDPSRIASSILPALKLCNATAGVLSFATSTNDTNLSRASSLRAAINDLGALQVKVRTVQIQARATALASESREDLSMAAKDLAAPPVESLVRTAGRIPTKPQGATGRGASAHDRRRKYGSSMAGRRRHP